MSDPPADLDLRLVRYFTVVADHRHFGRAAAALRIAQPSLSRQIRRLEQQLGARLLDRTPQGSRLTEAGEVFLPAAPRRCCAPPPRPRRAPGPRPSPAGSPSATPPNLIVTPAVRDLRRRHPDADVHTLHLAWNEPRAALLDHRVDAVVTRLPFRTDRLHVTVLYDEPRVLLVPLDHRLAGKESVTLDDIADEPLPRVPDPALERLLAHRPPARRKPGTRRSPRRRPSRTSSNSSPAGRPSPSSRPGARAAAPAPTSPRSPCRASSRAMSCWPPAPATAAAS